MMQNSDSQTRRDFSRWLRTGAPPPDGAIEFKFNPWHDPTDGRFTFTGAGHYAGPGDAPLPRKSGKRAQPIALRDDHTLPPIKTRDQADAWRIAQLADHGGRADNRAAIEARYRQYVSALEASPGGVAAIKVRVVLP